MLNYVYYAKDDFLILRVESLRRVSTAPFGGIQIEAVCLPRVIREKSRSRRYVCLVENFCSSSEFGLFADY